MKRKKKNWFCLLGMFLSVVFFISSFVILFKYGTTTAFFQFDNPNGLWEKLINIGIFWVIGMFCIQEFYDELEGFKGGKK